MKAIVLTFDGNQRIADHMIRCFDALWPRNSLKFHVPYQSVRLIQRPGGVEYVVSPSPIVATVLNLLSGIPEDEWVFWCMDDHFPIKLDLSWLEALTSDIHGDAYRDIHGVNFCASYRKKRYWRNALIRQGDFRAIGKNTFVEIPDYDQIWLPQFIRAGALRRFFVRMPEPLSGAKEMDDSKRTLSKPREDVLLLTGRDRAIFAESTYAGQYTEDFVASATKMGVGLEKDRLTRGVVWKECRGKMGIADRIEKLIK